MRNTAFMITTFLLASLATAQSMIPLPAFGRTRSTAITMGFFCRAPVDFTIVGLRVPDESSHGKQNVCLYKHASAPPPFSKTVPLTPVFFKFGEPSAHVIRCHVGFKTGEWMIALGACGDAATLRHSYAGTSGAFQSNILGSPTTLYRGGTQANIIAAPPPHAVWNEILGVLCRVEVYVVPASRAMIIGQGSGLPGSTYAYSLLSTEESGFAYQVGSSFGKGPIPIDRRQLGLTPDALLVLSVGGLLPAVFRDYSGFLNTAGRAAATMDIPGSPSLKGIRVYSAFVTLHALAPSGVASISNTFDFTIQ